jgi:hypothetical protein
VKVELGYYEQARYTERDDVPELFPGEFPASILPKPGEAVIQVDEKRSGL